MMGIFLNFLSVIFIVCTILWADFPILKTIILKDIDYLKIILKFPLINCPIHEIWLYKKFVSGKTDYCSTYFEIKAD